MDSRGTDLARLRLQRANAESEVEERRIRTSVTFMLTLGAASFVVAGVLLLFWIGVDHPAVVILPALVFGAACCALATRIQQDGRAASARLLAVSRELATAESAAGAAGAAEPR